jgi:hypothetical protein
MSSYRPYRKGTILLLSGSSNHLFIICNDPVFYPSLNKDCFLAVNLTSIKDFFEHDQTCVFNGGEHPFIKHPSYVNYKKSEILGENTISREVDSGNIQTHAPCDEGMFDLVLNGFSSSPFLTPKIKRFYEKYCI